jgi:hypothetical protein
MKLSKLNRKNKKAALELSIGTIVILVLAMSMLILGLILVRTIFTGAKYNVETMNTKVEEQINKLFVEDQRAVLYLPNRKADIKQGKDFGMAFGIQNVVKEQRFRWEIKVDDPDISRKCGVREQEAERWITTGRVGRAEIASGQKHSNLARFNIPEGSVNDISTCIIRYNLIIREEDGSPYQTEVFDVDVN